jgi:hypothetical protein
MSILQRFLKSWSPTRSAAASFIRERSKLPLEGDQGREGRARRHSPEEEVSIGARRCAESCAELRSHFRPAEDADLARETPVARSEERRERATDLLII